MLENIVRHIEEGEKPFEAALKGSREIGFTIVSMTLSLVAVFIPVLFMGGVVGRMFNEFGLVITLRHPDLGHRVADADADAVRAAAASRSTITRSAASCCARSNASFDAVTRGYACGAASWTVSAAAR